MSTVMMLQISQERFQREGQVEKTCSKKAGSVSSTGQWKKSLEEAFAWPGQSEAKGEEVIGSKKGNEVWLACGEENKGMGTVSACSEGQARV